MMLRTSRTGGSGSWKKEDRRMAIAMVRAYKGGLGP